MRDSLCSEHGALYYPWIEVPGAGEGILVPPSGHLAGRYRLTRSIASGGVSNRAFVPEP